MNTNILERFGIKSVGTSILHNSLTDKAELKIPQANSVTLDVKSDSVDIKENGTVVYSFPQAKEGTLKLTCETTSFAQLAVALGSKDGLVLNTSSSNFDSSETFKVTSDGTLELTLTETPVAGTAISAHLLTSDGEFAKSLTTVVDSSNAKLFTITDADLKIGNTVEVNYIKALATGKVYEFKVGSKSDGKPYRLTTDVICTFKDGRLGMGLLNIPKVKANESLSLTLDSEKASTFDIEFKVLANIEKKDENGNPEFFSMQILNEDAE